jgi:hypothetical protein
MLARIMTLAVCCFLLAAPLAIAEDKSIGQTFGEAGRIIVEDSRGVYAASKNFAVKTGQAISEDAQEAYEEGKQIGPRIAEDFKEGFQGNGQTPETLQDAAPPVEKP